MNELLFCKIDLKYYINMYIFACTCVNVMSNEIFAPLKLDPSSATEWYNSDIFIITNSFNRIPATK